MLDRHSLFWRLAILLVGFCLLMIGLSYSWGRYMETQNAFLSKPARQLLQAYAVEAEQAWHQGGQAGIDQWLQGMRAREQGFVGVINSHLHSLSSTALTAEQTQRLTRLRQVDWPMSRRSVDQPWLRLPFADPAAQAMLVIELPTRLNPGQYLWLWRILINGVIPGLFTLLLCVGLYRMLIVPLNQLREQPMPGAPISSRRGWTRPPWADMTSWVSWRVPSTRWPSAFKAPWPCSNNCCATCPTKCARR